MISPTVPILMYHQIARVPVASFRKYTVTPPAFDSQMRWLARAGYAPITLDRLLDHRRGRGRLPERPIIITFDDGFQECIDYAVPILRAYGFTAIFYLVTGLVGKTSEWLNAERGIAFPLAGWDAARQLLVEGLQCGAHTLSHPRLADLDAAACRTELSESRLILEEQLGSEIRHLAYPFGSFNEHVRSIAIESGYHSACSVRSGHSRPDDDLQALHRVHVLGQDSLLDFICRVRTSRSFRETLRAIAQSLSRSRAMEAPRAR